MPNDDLGQFPTPSSTGPSSAPTFPTDTAPTEPTTQEPEPSPTFEETPDEIPSVASTQSFPESIPEEPIADPSPPEPTPSSEPDPEPVATPQPIQETQSTVTPYQPAPEPTPQPTPATLPKGGSSFGSLITIILLAVAGIAIAATVFLFSQSQQLQRQLSEVTKTLEQQTTTVTPTPTPSIIEFTTPTPSPESTDSAIPTTSPTATATPTPTPSINPGLSQPLANATKALQVGINHQPNAQLILIKVENAHDPQLTATKYFFRQDLTTKKYFYVMITGNQEPAIVDTAIYVTPDNNIPSLNELVLGTGLGADLGEAVIASNEVCSSNLCTTASIRAQYIKVGENLIWQLTFDPQDAAKDTLVIQINASTKDILYKSPGF